MSTFVERLFWGMAGDEIPVVEYLHLHLPPSGAGLWTWARCARGAFVFSDLATAQRVMARLHWTDGSGRVVRPLAVPLPARPRREDDLTLTLLRMERLHPHEQVFASTERRVGA